MLTALALFAALPAVLPTFLNLGCGCPPPPLCLPPIQLPQLCLPRIELPQIQLCNSCGRKKRDVDSGNDIQDFERVESNRDTCNNENLKTIMERVSSGLRTHLTLVVHFRICMAPPKKQKLG